MESNNNGKITVGILTMFVIAISIIGVTYAYFTAQFSTNLNPESVKITAGELIANYKLTESLKITNVVPGWVSDGLHYYDVDVAAANEGKIYATKATTGENGTLGKGYAIEKYGIAKPIAFSVSNGSESDDDINYIITLSIKKNGIYDAWAGIADEETVENAGLRETKQSLYEDRSNLYATLYKGTFDIEKGVSDHYGTGNSIVAGPFLLADTGVEQVMVTAPETIAKGGAEQDYFIVFKFANETDKTQMSQGIQLNIEANVVGIQKDNDASVTYGSLIDSDSLTYTSMVARDEGNTETAIAAEKTDKEKRLLDYKNEHSTKTVWYDADNRIVIFALDADEKSDGLGD